MALIPNDRLKIEMAIRKKVFEESDNKCFYCGVELNFKSYPNHRYGVIDHIHPVSKGGKDKKENYRASCFLCNIRKSNKSVEEYRQSIHEKSKEARAADLIWDAMQLFKFSNEDDLKKAMFEAFEAVKVHVFYGEKNGK